DSPCIHAPNTTGAERRFHSAHSKLLAADVKSRLDSPDPMPRLAQVLALVAAFIGAGGTILVQRGLRGSDPYTGFWINLVVGTIGLWTGVVVTGGIGRVNATSIVYFVLAGFIGTFAGR